MRWGNMPELPENTLKIIIAFIVTALTSGALGFRIGKKQSVMGSGSVADQSKANAGGDIVGRDKVNK